MTRAAVPQHRRTGAPPPTGSAAPPRRWARRRPAPRVRPGPDAGPGRGASAPRRGVPGRSGGPGCGVPAPPGAAGLGLAGRRRRPGGQRRGRHRLASHHHAGVRAVPVRGRLRRRPARGADRPAHAHRRTDRASTRRSGCAPGLVSNTGMWVQGQPGIGKSTIVKRLMTGLVAFGFTAVVPGDVQGRVQRPGQRTSAGGSGGSAAACTRSTRSTPDRCAPRSPRPAAPTATGCARPSAPAGCRCSRPWW